jgi:hypothetical protein
MDWRERAIDAANVAERERAAAEIERKRALAAEEAIAREDQEREVDRHERDAIPVVQEWLASLGLVATDIVAVKYAPPYTRDHGFGNPDIHWYSSVTTLEWTVDGYKFIGEVSHPDDYDPPRYKQPIAKVRGVKISIVDESWFSFQRPANSLAEIGTALEEYEVEKAKFLATPRGQRESWGLP